METSSLGVSKGSRVNIALVNELKMVYGAVDIDIGEVIAAAKTKPFVFMPFCPGLALIDTASKVVVDDFL